MPGRALSWCSLASWPSGRVGTPGDWRLAGHGPVPAASDAAALVQHAPIRRRGEASARDTSAVSVTSRAIRPATRGIQCSCWSSFSRSSAGVGAVTSRRGSAPWSPPHDRRDGVNEIVERPPNSSQRLELNLIGDRGRRTTPRSSLDELARAGSTRPNPSPAEPDTSARLRRGASRRGPRSARPCSASTRSAADVAEASADRPRHLRATRRGLAEDLVHQPAVPPTTRNTGCIASMRQARRRRQRTPG